MNIFYISAFVLWSVCVFANFTVIFTFFSIKSFRDNYSYWYTTALATLDLIFGSTCIPLQLLTMEGVILVNDLTCDIIVYYIAFLGSAEINLLVGMSIDRYINVSNPQMNDDRRRSVVRFFIFITIISTTTTLLMIIPDHEYDFTKSNCFFLKRNTSLSSWAKYALTIITFSQYTVMGYFNIKVFVILREFNSILQTNIANFNDRNGNNMNGSLVELSYHGGKASVAKIATSHSPPTIHEIRRGKTIQGWAKEATKERKLLIMIIALEFTSFFTNLPCALMYIAMNYFHCDICRESDILRNMSPWLFCVNQALDPLMLLLTNRSFRRGAMLISKKYSLSKNSE